MALLLLLASALAALAASASLEVDSHSLTVGQTVGLQVQVVDGSVAGVPRVPVSDGLIVGYSGQSTQRVMVNFKTTRIQQFTYTLTAQAEGSFVIGPLELEIGGKPVVAPAIAVKVGPREKLGEQARDVSAAVSQREAWLGQTLVYAFRFRTRSRVYDPRWTPPSFDGFIQEPTAEVASREYTVDQGGVAWNIQAIDIPIIASAAGERTIPAALLTAQVPRSGPAKSRGTDPFAMGPFARVDTTTDTMTTETLSVRVRELPTAGRPVDFSGLVGSFQLDARLLGPGGVEVAPGQSAAVRLGDSLTLELRLSGDGSLSAVKLPPPAITAGYRAYDDAPEVVGKVDDGKFNAVATFKRALVPEAEGNLDIAPVRLSVFDPAIGAFTTVESPAFRLDVAPGESAGGVTSYASGEADNRKDVAALGDDILPAPGDVRVGDRGLSAALPLAVGLPVLPLMGLLGLGLRDRLGRRAPNPRAVLRRRLAQLPTDAATRLAALEDLFREAAGMRLGVAPAGLDLAAVAGLGDEAAAIYRAIDQARYAGGGAGPDLEARVRRFVEAT
jgi:BatD DUF11 like domain